MADTGGPTVGRPPDDAVDLLRALTAARLAAELLVAAGPRCERQDLDIAAVVRELGIAVEQAGAAADRLIAAGYARGQRRSSAGPRQTP